MVFQCKKCKYRFENKDKSKKDAPKVCPWCNAPNSVSTVKSANELLTDVDDMLK